MSHLCILLLMSCVLLSVGVSSLVVADSRQECLQEGATFLGKIRLPETGSAAQWESLQRISRQFYPKVEELALERAPRPEYIDALQSIGAEIPECAELIDQVDELASSVPCFEREFPVPEIAVRELIRHSARMEELMEKYLICQYGTNKW